ncbi:unnamed protein product [Closterium sp. NIES-64]|nr:unnamed protein product [Closterium sp. NIES-64]
MFITTGGNVAPQSPPLVVPSGPVSPISPLPVPPPSIIIPPRELAQSAAYAGGARGAFAQKRGGVEQPSGLPPSLPPSLVHWPYATHMPAVSPGFTHLPKSHSDGNNAPPTASPATQGRMRHENWGEIGSPWQGEGGRGISPGMTPGVAESPASGGSAGWPAGSHGKVTRVPSGENRPIPVSTVPWQQPKMSPLRRTRSSPCGEDAPGGGGTIWEQWQALGGWGRKAEGNQGSAGSGGGGNAAGLAEGGSSNQAIHVDSLAPHSALPRVPMPVHGSLLLPMHHCRPFSACLLLLTPAYSFDSGVAALLPSLLSSPLSHAFFCLLPSHHIPPLPSHHPPPHILSRLPAFPDPAIRYSLPEAPLGGVEDCCTHCCCNACALMQEMQEMQVHGDIPAVKVTPAPHSGTDGEGGNGATARKRGKVGAALRAPTVITM